MRTIVDIPEEIIVDLDRLSTEAKCSRAALIREALTEYTQSRAVQEMQAAYGIWRHRNKDGLSYQREVRSEWDER